MCKLIRKDKTKHKYRMVTFRSAIPTLEAFTGSTSMVELTHKLAQMINISDDLIKTINPKISKLMAAMLVRALRDITKSKGKDYFSAVEWIGSNNLDYIFSFLNICRFLNLEPKKIRAAIKSPQLHKCLWEYGEGRNYRQYLSILKKGNCS